MYRTHRKKKRKEKRNRSPVYPNKMYTTVVCHSEHKIVQTPFPVVTVTADKSQEERTNEQKKNVAIAKAPRQVVFITFDVDVVVDIVFLPV